MTLEKKNRPTNFLGTDVLEIEKIKNNPHCIHGPTILFEKHYEDKDSQKYYACSASRDRKFCNFYQDYSDKISDVKMMQLQKRSKMFIKQFKKRKFIISRLNEIKDAHPHERKYCHDCKKLFLSSEKKEHKSCNVHPFINDEQLMCPSTFLKPLEDVKYEAQYLFGNESVDMVIKMLAKIGADKVICIGAPRIHEKIKSLDCNISSLMLDIDVRYCNFFSKKEFLIFNMFNNYFFEGEIAENRYKKFLTGASNIAIVCDPPFGGKIELIGNTFKSIQKDWIKINNLVEGKYTIPFILAFPYFSEPQVKSALPFLNMLNYQVEYENHPLFSNGKHGMKNGSAVRFFVNERGSRFNLPEDKYKFCDDCYMYVGKDISHCYICKGCMSKDGRQYVHCKKCRKCVKPHWSHCKKCKSCCPKEHKCGSLFNASNNAITCHICKESGHKRQQCPNNKKRPLDKMASKEKKQKVGLEE